MRLELIKAKVIAQIDMLEQDLIDLTRALVAFPSLHGQEKAAQEYYADRLAGLGGIVDIWEPQVEKLKKHPAFISSREDFSGSPVQVTRFPGTGGGRSLLLCGHMDVVPPGDGVWTMDPWQGDYREGRIYGRGSADMKGGLAASLIALQALKESGIRLQGDVLAATTVDEECGSTGVLAIIERGYRADAGLIPEPTGLELNTASTGSIWFKIRVKGMAAHAGMAYRGVSSIDKAIIVIQALARLQEERRIRLMHPLYADLPVPFCLNVNTIRAGTWPAVVPPEAILEGRMGVSPDESIEEARQDLEEALARCAAGDRWLQEHPPLVEYMPCRWNSGSVSEAHPFSQILKRTVEDICHKPAKISGMGPCSDSGTLIRFADIPTINFGPCSMAMAHQTDEYVDIGSLLATAKVMALTMMEWCGTAEGTGGEAKE
jgi:acetylornithine deacetylase